MFAYLKPEARKAREVGLRRMSLPRQRRLCSPMPIDRTAEDVHRRQTDAARTAATAAPSFRAHGRIRRPCRRRQPQGHPQRGGSGGESGKLVGTTGHARAQIFIICAENLSARAPEFARRIRQMTGANKAAAAREVEASIRRLSSMPRWADKYDGPVHNPPLRGVALAMNEPIGVIGIACPDEAPCSASLLGRARRGDGQSA